MTTSGKEIHPQGDRIAPSQSRVFVEIDIRAAGSEVGNAAFARQEIPSGTVVGVDGGTVLRSLRGTEGGPAFLVVIERGLYLAPSLSMPPDALCLLNHSCAANIARLGGLVYAAKRDIRRGEMLTIDYAPLVSGHLGWRLDCLCGTPSCRRVVTEQDWRDPDLAERLWPEWLPFVQQQVLLQRRATHTDLAL